MKQSHLLPTPPSHPPPPKTRTMSDDSLMELYRDHRWGSPCFWMNDLLNKWMKPGLSWWRCMQRVTTYAAKLGLPSLGRKNHSFWSVLALSYFNPETDGLCVLCCPAFQGIRIRLSSRALLGCCLAQWSHSFTPLPCAHRDDSAISITTLIAHT